MKHRRQNNDASRRYHDRVARQYDAIYDDAYWEFYDRLNWLTIKRYLPSDANARCCDLGCGTGKWGLKLLKSGYPTTFVDHSAAMIEQARSKIEAMGAKAAKATMMVGDIVDLPGVESDQFQLILAMGDPLSICSHALRAAGEMRRICKPGGVVIATADNKLAAMEHFMDQRDTGGLQEFLRTSKTRWLTDNEREQFELTTFTPAELRRLFERSGWEILSLLGRTILPVRQYRHLLSDDAEVERLLRMEMELAKDESGAGRAAHLQVIARKPTS
jgi:ubiquinone/menaquinone biosynthesis C-methylase UbiE